MENEWEELFSEKHQKKYWKNKGTGKTSWKDPKVSATNNTGEKESKEEKPKDADDWEELFSDKHKKKYWKNKVTGKTSWTAPVESTTSADKAAVPSEGKSSAASVGGESEWVECFSEKHNKKYWKHKVNGKTSWKSPEKSSFISTASTSTAITNAPQSSKEEKSKEADDWEELFSEKHKKKYWKNKETGATTWKTPYVTTVKEVEPTAAQKVENTVPLVDDMWEELFSEKHNRKYWKNKETGKISWTKPPTTDATPVVSSNTSVPTAINPTVAASSSEWEELFNEKHKRKYWKSKITGKFSWTNPAVEEEINTAQKPIADKQDKSDVVLVSNAPKIEPLKRLIICLANIKFANFEETAQIIEVKISGDGRHSILLYDFGDSQNTSLNSTEALEQLKIFKSFQAASFQSVCLGEGPHQAAINLVIKMADGDNGSEIQSIENISFTFNHGCTTHRWLRMIKSVFAKLIKAPDSIAPAYNSQMNNLFQPWNILSNTASELFVCAMSELATKETQLHAEVCLLEKTLQSISHQSNNDDQNSLHINMLSKPQFTDSELLDELPSDGIVLLSVYSTHMQVVDGFEMPNILYFPCYLRVSPVQNQLLLYEYGPNQPPSIILQQIPDVTSLQVSNLSKPNQEFMTLSLFNFQLILPSTRSSSNGLQNEIFYHLTIRYQSYSELLKWSLSLSSICCILKTFTNDMSHSHVLNQHSINKLNGKINLGSVDLQPLYFAERNFCEQEIFCDYIRHEYQKYSGLQLKSMQFQLLGCSLVVTEHGDCKSIPNYSIILSINGLSAFQNVRSESLFQLVSDLPDELRIDIEFIKFPRFDCQIDFTSFDISEVHNRIVDENNCNAIISYEKVTQAFIKQPQAWQNGYFRVTDGKCFILGDERNIELNMHTISFQLVSFSSLHTKSYNYLLHVSDSTTNIIVKVPSFGVFQCITRKLHILMRLYGNDNGTDWHRISHEADLFDRDNYEEFLDSGSSQFLQKNSVDYAIKNSLSGLLNHLQLDCNQFVNIVENDEQSEFLKATGESEPLASSLLSLNQNIILPHNSNPRELLFSSVEGLEGLLKEIESTLPTFTVVENTLLEIKQLNRSSHQFIHDLLSIQHDRSNNNSETSGNSSSLLFKDSSSNLIKNSNLMLDTTASEEVPQLSQIVVPISDTAQSDPSQSGVTEQQTSFSSQSQQVESSTEIVNNDVSVEEDSSIPSLSSLRRGSALTSSNPVSLPPPPTTTSSNSVSLPPPTTTSSGNLSTAKMQRRASRLSINIDLSAAAAVASATVTSTASTPAVTNPSNGMHSNSTAATVMQPPVNSGFIPPVTATAGSIFNTKPFSKAFSVSTEEQIALKFLFSHLRENPSLLIQHGVKISNSHDLLIFGYILIHRLFQQFSCHYQSILNLLKACFDIESSANHSVAHLESTSNAPTLFNNIEEVSTIGFNDFISFFMQSHNGISNISSHQSYNWFSSSSSQSVQPNSLRSKNNHIMWSTHPFFCVLLYESLQRMDIVNFADKLCKSTMSEQFLQQIVATLNETLIANPSILHGHIHLVENLVDISAVCMYCIDPLISKLEALHVREEIPHFYLNLLSMWKQQSNDEVDTRMFSKLDIESELKVEFHRIIFISTFIPHLIKYLRHKMVQFLQMEKLQTGSMTPFERNRIDESQHPLKNIEDDVLNDIVTRILDKVKQVMLLACGIQSVGKLSLSLADNAVLSKCNWRFNRSLDGIVQDCRTIYNLLGKTDVNSSLISAFAKLHPYAPHLRVMDSFVCMRPSELLFLFEVLDVGTLSSPYSKIVTLQQKENCGQHSAEMLPLFARAVVDAIHIIQRKDLMGRILQYSTSNTSSGSLFHSSNSSHKKTFVMNQLDREFTFLIDLDFQFGIKTKDTMNTHSNGVNRVSMDISNPLKESSDAIIADGSDGANNTQDFTMISNGSETGQSITRYFQELQLHLNRIQYQNNSDLQSIHWLLNAGRSALSFIYSDQVHFQNSYGLIREINDLNDKLKQKYPVIVRMQQDWKRLQHCKEVMINYKTQLQMNYSFQKQQLSMQKRMHNGHGSPGDFWKGPMLSSGANDMTSANVSANRYLILTRAVRAFASIAPNHPNVVNLNTSGINWSNLHEDETENSFSELLSYQLSLEKQHIDLVRVSCGNNEMDLKNKSLLSDHSSPMLNGSYSNEANISTTNDLQFPPTRSVRPATGGMNPLRVVIQNVFT